MFSGMFYGVSQGERVRETRWRGFTTRDLAANKLNAIAPWGGSTADLKSV